LGNFKTKTMKKIVVVLLSVALLAGISLAFIGSETETESLNLGDAAPHTDVKMKAVTGTELSLEDARKENGLLVIFSCNTCPFVVGTGSKEGWEKRYNGIYDLSEKNGIGMVLVNSNEAFRGNEDSFEAMVKHAEKLGYKSPYVVDQNHLLADAFGARTTPHVFLFNNELKLVYTGAIDDNNASSADVKEHYLRDAITNLVAGAEINPGKTKSLGCSIKRVKK